MKKEGLLCGVRGPEERPGGDTDTVIMTKIILFKITRATEKGGTQPVSGVLRSCHWQSSNGPQSRGSRRPGCHFLSSVPRAQDPKASGLQEGGSRSPLPGPRSPQLWAGSPRCTAALRQFRKQTAGVGRCAWRHSLSWGPTHQTRGAGQMESTLLFTRNILAHGGGACMTQLWLEPTLHRSWAFLDPWIQLTLANRPGAAPWSLVIFQRFPFLRCSSPCSRSRPPTEGLEVLRGWLAPHPGHPGHNGGWPLSDKPGWCAGLQDPVSIRKMLKD